MSLISNVRFRPMEHATGSLKAFGTATVAGVADVSFKVVEGRNGLFISWPSRKADKPDAEGKTKYFNDFTFIDRETGDEAQKLILTEFANGGGTRPQTEGASPPRQQRGLRAPKQPTTGPDGIPF